MDGAVLGDAAGSVDKPAEPGPFCSAGASGSAKELHVFSDRFSADTSRQGAMRHRWWGETRLSWKLCYEMTMADYHVQFGCPESIGETALPSRGPIYEREGPHSQLLRRRTSDWTFSGFRAGLERLAYEATRTERQVSDEDRQVSEARQQVVADLRRPAIFGALEQRRAWCHESVGVATRERIGN